MKKIALIVALTISSVFAWAKPSDVFEYSEEQVISAMDDIDRLEQYVESSGGTLTELQANPELTKVYDLNNFEVKKPMSPAFSFDEMDWGAFAWGCLCWPIGCIVVVLNNDKDNDSKLSFLIGVGVAFLSNAIFYVVYWSLWGGYYYY